MNNHDLLRKEDYRHWLDELKSKVRRIQIKAALSVNRELLLFYWELGADIVRKQTEAKWGDGFLKQLSVDLMDEFPEIKGFSERNLKYIRQWHFFFNQQPPIGKQVVAQLRQQAVRQITQIPWGHNIAIISKCKTVQELRDWP